MTDALSTQKMEIDYSKEVDQLIPDCILLAKTGQLEAAINKLSNMEKLTRTSCDMNSTAKVLIAIAQICFENKKWVLLNENLKVFTKKRNQLKQAVIKLIQEVCTYVSKIDDLNIKLDLIETVREVTQGKLYVEIERARLTKILSEIKESQGKIKEAMDVLHDVQIDTLGAMEKIEKFEFILEQMRLCILNSDYLRMQIISKKITSKTLQDLKDDKLKLKYFELMIQLYQHEKQYLLIASHYKYIYDLPSLDIDKQTKDLILSNIIIYTILAQYSNEQIDMLNRIGKDKNIDHIPKFKLLIKCFLTNEIIDFKKFSQDFADIKNIAGYGTIPACFLTPERWDVDMKNRINEHNIRILSIYYQRISLSRMSQLLSMPIEESETFLQKAVVDKLVQAKIDRLDNIITFVEMTSLPTPTTTPSAEDEWARNNEAVMNHVNHAVHLINKEFMLSKIKTPSAA